MIRRYSALLLVLLLAVPLLAQSRRTRTSSVTIPDGTNVYVRFIDNLDSGKTAQGATFRGTLDQAIMVNGREVFPRGADVVGHVDAVHRSGRLSDPGVLVLTLRYIEYNGRRADLHTEPFQIKGESHTKSNVTKIGGGAAAGAVIGAIVGGGKGAAIGAGVGAAGGTGVAAATGKKEAKVESEAVLSFTTTSSSTVGAAGREYDQQNDRYDDRNDDRNADRGRDYSDEGSDENYNVDDYMFTDRDQRVIRRCFQDNSGNLPPGLAKRDRLPPGLERQLQRNGTLPPGLQKRIQPLPQVCDDRLPRLPSVLRRVVYVRRVMLLDSRNVILDIFNIDEE